MRGGVFRAMPRFVCLIAGPLLWIGGACATGGRASTSPAPPEPPRGAETASPDVLASVDDAEAALSAGNVARAAALFGRFLAQAEPSDPDLPRAYLGLARAHEGLRDCGAAVVAYEAFLERYPSSPHRVPVLARRGACEAELEQWDRSAASFAAIAATPEILPSVLVEAFARQGYALFQRGELDAADAVLARADEVYLDAERREVERFASHYFVAMARFYRAAVIHRRFRETKIELPEAVMEARFKRKLELLNEAQDAYNYAIRAKHMFWISAAGYQLGHLFSELYDDLMDAPVPEWLDARQRAIYYEELKKQLEPVFQKAVWVFEKNLETARRFGYESPFIEDTQAKLAHIQAALLSSSPDLGRPHPRLTMVHDERDDPLAAPETLPRGTSSRLFVPPLTPL